MRDAMTTNEDVTNPIEIFKQEINFVTTFESGFRLAFSIMKGEFNNVGQPPSDLLAQLGTRLVDTIPNPDSADNRYTNHVNLLTTILAASAQLRQAESTKQG